MIVPNVSRFFGRGTEEARKAEKHGVQLAVAALMTDLNVPNLKIAITGWETTVAEYPNTGITPDFAPAPTNDMGAFPDDGDVSEYVLYPEYLHTQYTQYTYTVNEHGTVTQGDKYEPPAE